MCFIDEQSAVKPIWTERNACQGFVVGIVATLAIATMLVGAHGLSGHIHMSAIAGGVVTAISGLINFIILAVIISLCCRVCCRGNGGYFNF